MDYKESLDRFKDGGQVVDAYFGADQCLHIEIPGSDPSNYHATPAGSLGLATIPGPKGKSEGFSARNDLVEIWETWEGHFPLRDCDNKPTKEPQIYTTLEDGDIMKVEDTENPAIIITVVTTKWTRSLLLPLSSALGVKLSRAKARFNTLEEYVNAINKDQDFTDLQKEFTLLGATSSDEDPPHLLDILVAPLLHSRDKIRHERLTAALVDMVVKKAKEADEKEFLDMSFWEEHGSKILAVGGRFLGPKHPSDSRRIVIGKFHVQPGFSSFQYLRGFEVRMAWTIPHASNQDGSSGVQKFPYDPNRMLLDMQVSPDAWVTLKQTYGPP
ncbi:hypothetical protein N7492_000441 [Penicillium capsulatum]|uniref:Uncharacterized protein n=1 Tax=Penicillium capsulatum TaxID=69766 RepID=A0A9W9IQE8_9EURO|nr:hypothetical protein N7492_000441 [Penicillium capsulatum]KAJ6130497.1 hypothetical protein N7512_003277 [Penicillium capsulatum]